MNQRCGRLSVAECMDDWSRIEHRQYVRVLGLSCEGGNVPGIVPPPALFVRYVQGFRNASLEHGIAEPEMKIGGMAARSEMNELVQRGINRLFGGGGRASCARINDRRNKEFIERRQLERSR